MTRRGSLIYYLTAWVCCCVFMSTAVWLSQEWDSRMHGMFGYTRGWLIFCFFGLATGAFASLLFAWLLRSVARIFRARSSWQWLILGAVLAQGLIWAAGALLTAGPAATWALRHPLLVGLLLSGPGEVYSTSRWFGLIVGAATSGVLFLIYQAFEPAKTLGGEAPHPG